MPGDGCGTTRSTSLPRSISSRQLGIGREKNEQTFSSSFFPVGLMKAHIFECLLPFTGVNFCSKELNASIVCGANDCRTGICNVAHR